MSFVSLEFPILLAVVLALLLVSNRRMGNWILLVASYVFYGWWDWRFLSLLVGVSVFNFLLARLVDPSAPGPGNRTAALTAGIVVNLSVLGCFKYFDFFLENLVTVGRAIGFDLGSPALRLVLPLGISFFIFQALGYLIDVYRGSIRRLESLPDFLLFISFFPQLVAGPIERAGHLVPQIAARRRPAIADIESGLGLLLIGFVKKVVIADRIALFVDPVYAGSPANGAAVLLATYGFAIQIYCDFSGYTDIARGAARMLGFDLLENFKAPYLSTGPNEFWGRWHITLSSWVRDYLYISLGGNRRGQARTLFNLAVTMVLVGLWHGASWHFVAWGAFHGLLLVVGRARSFASPEPRPSEPSGSVGRALRAAFFFHLVCLGWLLFRAESLGHAWALLMAIAAPSAWSAVAPGTVIEVVGFLAAVLVFQFAQVRTGNREFWTQWHPAWRGAMMAGLFYAAVLLGAPAKHEFIYFQF